MEHYLIATKATKQTRTIGDELSWIRVEQHRIATEHKITADLQQHVEDDLAAEEQAYQAWKKANGLHRKLSGQKYEIEFSIYA